MTTMEPVPVQPVPTCPKKWDNKAVKFFIKNEKSFRNGSWPRARWPMRLVLVRATPRAEVDVISVKEKMKVCNDVKSPG